MSFIYCITNKINNKKYVGKTNGSVDKRFKKHISDSHRERCEKRPLYDAMNKYGSENFSIEVLEECPCDEAESKEVYWIKRLNTYSNGYNATIGGDGKSFLDYEKILYDIDNTLLTQKDIAKKHGCCIDSVRAIAKYYDRGIDWQKRNLNNIRRPIFMIDKDTGNIIKSFPSSFDAVRYIKGESAKKSDKFHIDQCCNEKRKTAYGYKWKYQ